MRDLDFDDLLLFARVAELGTLSAVARERDAPVSLVSRALARIEKSCGARLIHRSTHGLSLTPEGETFLDYCQRLGATWSELETEFEHRAERVAGRVRVAASPAMAEYLLVPSLGALAERHPKLQIDIHADDRLVDMARDGIDLAIRSGGTPGDGMIARPIGSHTRGLYAAPDYLAARGEPRHPDELAGHALITNSAAPHLNRWPFIIEGEPAVRAVQGGFSAASTGVMMAMVLGGLGICRCVDLIARPLVAAGRLTPVLDTFTDAQRFPIYALLLPERHRLPKIRACVDHWAAWFGRA